MEHIGPLLRQSDFLVWNVDDRYVSYILCYTVYVLRRNLCQRKTCPKTQASMYEYSWQFEQDEQIQFYTNITEKC